ncbi:MAG: hypothetical protein H0V30_00080 [Chitinophagaceae bacterium]|jgi:hypothetical protein|nr:hypothetical protein [Chitinophagaceae bacterium]
MLKEIFDLVRSTAEESVLNKTQLPAEQNEAVVAEATNTVASGLRNMVAGGGVQNILDIFGNKGGNKKSLLSNPLVLMMIGHFAGKLISKYKMNSNQANNIAGDLIPGVLGNLINKTNDPNDSQFSLDEILASITGGQSKQIVQEKAGPDGGLMDIIGQMTSGGQSNGGGLMDIIGRMATGAQQQQERNGGGGLLDLIKGFAK